MLAAGQIDPSLLSGFLPIVLQGVAFVVLAVAVGRRPKRWWLRWFPVLVAVAVLTIIWARWYIQSEGMTGEPVPLDLWFWIGLSGFAIALNGIGWPSAQWWRRAVAIVAVPLCMASACLAVNAWVGYARTVRGAWALLMSGPLPGQVELDAVKARAAQGKIPRKGAIVRVTIGDEGSGFKHRDEYVYVPPAWFSSVPPPSLPVVLMIGGAFGTPADWLRAGDAARTIDAFAESNGGNAPIFVFPDKGGAFNNDTECVNGPRGRAADHLIKDVMPYVRSTFATAPNSSGAAVVGWSMGGTCAVTLGVKYPETFSTFISMAGDSGPNMGDRDQTIDKLYGGDEDAFRAFDPVTVMEDHGPYHEMAGLFAVQSPVSAVSPPAGSIPTDSHLTAAQSLCNTARENQIYCKISTFGGGHDWSFGAEAFRKSLPWLASRLQTPGVTKEVGPP